MTNATLMAAFFATSTWAGEWVIAVGGDDLLDNDREEATALTFEIRTDPIHSNKYFDLSWVLAAQGDSKGELYVGAGVNAYSQIRASRYFFEVSAVVGPYFESGVSLKLPEEYLFRTSIGFGAQISDNARLSLSIDHLLNGNLENRNPGSEAIMLRLTQSF